MASDRKLSKKEQKAAAFRSNEKQRSKDKGKGKSRNDASSEAADLPENDLLDDHGRLAQPEEQDDEAKSVLSSIKTKKSKKKREDDQPAGEDDKAEKDSTKKSKGKGKDTAADSAGAQVEKEGQKAKSAGKKRKRAAHEDGDASEASGSVKAKKTTFSEEGQPKTTVAVASDSADSQAKGAAAGKEDGSAAKEQSSSAKRYIAFVGNMSFKTTPDEIAAHFASHCGEKPSVRLLTKKVDPEALSQLSKSKQKSIAKGKASHPAAGGTSRGCGFIEFKDAAALQKALHFHHTFLGARQINVELTAGGGGKTKERLAKIKTKNEKLDKERQKLHEKYVEPASVAKAKQGDGAERAAKRPRKEDEGGSQKSAGGEGAAQWGQRGAGGGAKGKTAQRTMPKWMASGANAVRLQG